MSSRSYFHHFGLAVPDLEEAIGWYAAVLGLEATDGFVVAGGVRAVLAGQLELFEIDDSRRHPPGSPIEALRRGVGHVAFVVPDLDAAYERALAAGGRSIWTPREAPVAGRRMAFVTDPGGNVVEMLGV